MKATLAQLSHLSKGLNCVELICRIDAWYQAELDIKLRNALNDCRIIRSSLVQDLRRNPVQLVTKVGIETISLDTIRLRGRHNVI